MPGLGTVMNCVAIVLGSLIGVVLKRGLPEKWQQTMMGGIALCIVVIGLQMALKTNNIIITIISLVIGAIIGEAIDIEEKMARLGDWIGSKVAKGDASVAAKIAEGFVNASILFCTGAMAIVGSIQDGILADHTTLFAKGTLDGIISLILAANMGIGVMLSSISVGIYQGSITMLAGVVEPYVTPVILAEVTAAGGVMIMAIGTNMLNVTKIRIANLLPGMLSAAILAAYFG
ncbi:MAG: DUF554 domain-containing protein [Phascolarctobacterium sp.]|nr:DUF554 domain-containing protein [Phascolarctobacterium sp.]